MKPDSILEELWKIKDDLARESGYDTHRFFENLRQWAKDHPHTGPVVHNADELRQLAAEHERQRTQSASLVLKEAAENNETSILKPNPILEELWKIKDDLAREAGFDPQRFFENLRQWAKEHPHPGPVIHNVEELRQLLADEERRRMETAASVLKDAPGPKQ